MSLLRHAVAWNSSRVVAFHVNHRVRPEADAEEQWLSARLQQEGIKFDCRRLATTKRSHEFLRRARYAALGELAQAHGVRALLMAHHAGDFAETFVERVQMASGVAGLARPMSEIATFPGLPPVLRPVLWFSKEELRSILAESVVQDPSNTNPVYLRSRVRKVLDETPDARKRVLQVQTMMLQEWKAVESMAGQLGDEIPTADLLLDPGVRGSGARLALDRLLAKVSGTSRHRSSLLSHAIAWMTNPLTKDSPIAIFSEAGVRITWRKKTQSFRS